MALRRRNWLVTTVAVLVAGALVGATWAFLSGEDKTGDGLNSSLDGFNNSFSARPDFVTQYPSIVGVGTVEGVLTGQGGISGVHVTLSNLSKLWESDTSRAATPASEWPDDAVTFEATDGLDDDIPTQSRIVVFLTQNANVSWPWIADTFGLVDGDQVQMLNDPDGFLQVRLDHVASTLGVTQLEALTQIGIDVRERQEAAQETLVTPDDVGPAVDALLTFKVGDRAREDGEAAWLAEDPRLRGYDARWVPRSITRDAVWVPVIWHVAEDVANGDQNILIHVRDGIAINGSFVARLGVVDDGFLATPGNDIEIVLATWDDFIGEVIGVIPHTNWSEGTDLVINVTRVNGAVVAEVAGAG